MKQKPATCRFTKNHLSDNTTANLTLHIHKESNFLDGNRPVIGNEGEEIFNICSFSLAWLCWLICTRYDCSELNPTMGLQMQYCSFRLMEYLKWLALWVVPNQFKTREESNISGYSARIFRGECDIYSLFCSFTAFKAPLQDLYPTLAYIL